MSTLLHDYRLPDKNMPMPCKIKNFMGNHRGNFSLGTVAWMGAGVWLTRVYLVAG